MKLGELIARTSERIIQTGGRAELVQAQLLTMLEWASAEGLTMPTTTDIDRYLIQRKAKVTSLTLAQDMIALLELRATMIGMGVPSFDVNGRQVMEKKKTELKVAPKTVAVPLTVLEQALIHMESLLVEVGESADVLNNYHKIRKLVVDNGGVAP